MFRLRERGKCREFYHGTRADVLRGGIEISGREISYPGWGKGINRVTEEGEEEEGEVVILKVEDNDDEDSDEESYVSIEDEEILNKVFEIFKEKFKDDFDFVD